MNVSILTRAELRLGIKICNAFLIAQSLGLCAVSKLVPIHFVFWLLLVVEGNPSPYSHSKDINMHLNSHYSPHSHLDSTLWWLIAISQIWPLLGGGSLTAWAL